MQTAAAGTAAAMASMYQAAVSVPMASSRRVRAGPSSSKKGAEGGLIPALGHPDDASGRSRMGRRR